MTYKQKKIFTALCFSLGLVFFPAVSNGQNLIQIYNLAVTNDPELKRADAARLAALEARPQARSRFLPSVNVGANYTYQHQDLTTFPFLGSASENTAGSYPTDGYSLNLSQPLFYYDAFVQNRQADAKVAQAEAQFEAARLNLMLRVAERYFDVLAAQDNLSFAQAEKKATERQLEQTKQRFNVGLIAITDVHEAQASYDLTVAQEISAQNRLSNANEALREVTGQYHKELFALMKDTPLITPEPADIDKWAETALKQNLQLISSQFAVDIAANQIKFQRAQRYPTLDLVGSHNYSDNSDSLFFPTKTTSDVVSIQLNWNLFQGGRVSSLARQASYQFNEAEATLEQQRRSTVRQTRDAYLGVIAGISRVKALNQSVISHRSALEATEAGLEVGTRTTVDVLNARTNLYLAERDYAQSRYDYILNTLRLKQAAGLLSERDLDAINKWLE